MVPLLRPSASRTALGRVIWPRSATVASIGFLRRAEVWMEFTYFKNHTQSVILCRFPAPPATPPGSHAPSHRSFRPMSDSFATRARLDVNGKSYTYASLPKLGEKFDIARLPYSMKILLENLLRHEDGGATVGKAHIEAVAKWDPKAEPDTEIAFMPARVVLQDFTGVPCVVDLA